MKCGRKIPAGELAYWETDMGVWHLECQNREASHPQERRSYRFSSSGRFSAFLVGIVILAIVLGGFVIGPIIVRPTTTTVTVNHTATLATTVTVTTTACTSPPPKWLPRNPSDPEVINWADAAKYVGKTKTVEGTIVRTYRSPSNTIFLDFHDPYQGYFVVVIFASDLKNFPFTPEDFYRGKEVRISGLIKLYQGSPEIIVENPSQVEVAGMGFSYP